MNREDIIRMARQAGSLIEIAQEKDLLWLERFAALVASAEREACLDVVETHRIPVGNSSAGEMACEWTYDALKEISATIRKRG